MRKHERKPASYQTAVLVSTACALFAVAAATVISHAPGAILQAPLTTNPLSAIDGTVDAASGPERTGAAAVCTAMRIHSLRSATNFYLAVDVPELVADPGDALLLYFDMNHSGGSAPDAVDRAIRLVGFPAGTNQTPATVEIYAGNTVGWGTPGAFATVKSSRTGSGTGARLVVELTVPNTTAPVGFALVYASNNPQDCNNDFDVSESAFKFPLALPIPGGDDLAGVRVPSEWGDLGVVDKGTFTVTNLPVANFPGWTAVANATTLAGDFNSDGKTDLVVTGAADWTSVPTAFSNGDGRFNVRNFPIVNFGPWAATANVAKVAGDFNGDGRTDIALTGGAGWGSIPVAFSNGDGRYIVTNYPVADFPGLAAASGARTLAGDFNGDGKTDMALTGAAGWTTLPVAFSNGDGTFTVTPPVIKNFIITTTLATLAVNKAAVASAANPTIRAGAVNPTIRAGVVNPTIGAVLVSQPTIATFAGWAATANARTLVGDFNGDGKSDIALTGAAGWTTVPVALSQGNGAFTVTAQSVGEFAALAATPPQPVVIDSEPMIAAPGIRPPIETPGPFPLPFPKTFDTVKVLTGDFNGDGRTDIALTGLRSWSTFPVAFSNGNGSFTVTNLPIANFTSFSAVRNAKPLTGDFNNDGKTDVALTGPSGWTSLPVAFSTGNGTFIVTNQPVGDFGPLAAVANARPFVGDFNGDGKADVALTGHAGGTTIPVAFSQSQ